MFNKFKCYDTQRRMDKYKMIGIEVHTIKRTWKRKRGKIDIVSA